MELAGLFDFEIACERLNENINQRQGGRDPSLELNQYIDWHIFEKDLPGFQRSHRKASFKFLLYLNAIISSSGRFREKCDTASVTRPYYGRSIRF